ncbi:MAG: TonB-dependent receptor, partial [Bacteroidota bacterium]
DAGTNIGNYVQFRMRGIDQTRINTTLNGVPLNGMVDQGVFFSNFSDFGNSVSSIQIQRGVGIASNGVASYGGAIDFETPRLTGAEPHTELEFLSGSFGTLRMSAEVNSGLTNDGFGAYGKLSRTKTNGFKNNSGSEAYSLFFSGGYFGEKDVLTLTAFAGKTQNDQSYLPVLLQDIEADPKTNYNHPNDTDDFGQELVMLKYTRAMSPQLTSSTTAYYGHAGGVFPFGLDDETQLVFGLENDHVGILSDITYSGARWDLKGGLHAYTFLRKNVNYTAPNTSNPDYVDKTTKNEISLWGKASLNLEDFSLYGDAQIRSVGLDFEGEEVLSFGGAVPAGPFSEGRSWLFFNPRVGMTYRLDERSQLYASIGQTHREPTRTDILQGDGSSVNEFSFASLIDDEAVRHESVIDLELGYRLGGSDGSFTATAFYMDFTNEIAAVGALAERSYVAIRQNVPSSMRAGIELEGRMTLSPKWQGELVTTLMTSNIETFDNGSEIIEDVNHIFAPSAIVKPSIMFTPSSSWCARISGQIVSSSFIELSNNDEFTTPGFMTWDLSLSYQPSDRLALSINAFNLLDEIYFTDGAPVDLDFDGLTEGPGYRIQPPRHFYLMAKIEF